MPVVVAGMAAIVFSTVALTNVPLGWIYGSVQGTDPITAREKLRPTSMALPSSGLPDVGRIRITASCNECGVVDSMRRVVSADSLGDAPTVYELTVRMRDGSTRMVSASRANWRRGERITLIGGNPDGK
ncbi:MAG: hypothetical protein ABI900_11420 [Betaproteobacteria bacterium]